MAKIQNGYVTGNGITIHYYRTGGDLPQVILNHGALDDGTCWPRLVEALKDDYDLILPDARGHGLSDQGAGDYSADARAEDLIALIEALDLDQPIIGGHSMGGVTSLYVAARRPDLVAGFFMEDPVIIEPGDLLFGGQPAQDGRAAMRRLIRAWRFIKAAPKFISLPLIKRILPTATPEVIESWLASKQRVSEDFVQVLEDPGSLAIGLDDDHFHRIKIPGMLIYGSREKGAIVSQAIADGIREQVAGLRVVHLAEATHDIRRSQFSGYLGAVRDFLQLTLGSSQKGINHGRQE